MPTVARTRRIDADPGASWRLLADPHNLPRWWPRTLRVESVEGEPGARRSRFTQVFETSKGTAVRVDWRVVQSTRDERLVWEQQVEGTPFEGFLKGSELEIRIGDAGGRAEVTIEGRRDLRGVSKLGAPMMRRATRQVLDEALDGVELALVGEPG